MLYFRLPVLLTLLFATSFLHAAGAPQPAAPQAPAVVLKLDDLVAKGGKVPPRWQRIADFAEQRRIKVSIGIICRSLENDAPDYFAEIKRQAATGLVEFWHHGYDHRRWTEGDVTYCEFHKTSREHQAEHLLRGQRLAKEKLGITFTVFGAPYNATDATTADVMAADMPDIKVWLYGKASMSGGKFIAGRVKNIGIEAPVHKPNYAALVKGFEEHRAKNHRYHVLQGHPASWDDAAFAEFVRIVDYLAAQGCTFVFPSELPELAR